MQLPVNIDLTLCDVASQVGDWMCNVIVGHGQNRQLRDRTLAPLNAPRTLVDSGQVSIHVPCRMPAVLGPDWKRGTAVWRKGLPHTPRNQAVQGAWVSDVPHRTGG